MYTFCYRVYQSVASQKNRNHSRQNKQRRSEGQELVTKVVKGLKHKRQKERAPLERREGRTVSRTSEAALPRVGGGGCCCSEGWAPSHQHCHFPSPSVICHCQATSTREDKQHFAFSNLLFLVPVPRNDRTEQKPRARSLGDAAHRL